MKYILTIFSFFVLIGAKRPDPKPFAGSVYYMATDGDDANDGTLAEPFLSIEYSISFLTPGDTLIIRGGTHRSAKLASVVNRFYINGLNGTLANKITIKNYPGEVVVFDMDDVEVPGTLGDGPVGLKVEDSKHLHIKGIRVRNMEQNITGINTPAGAIFYNVDSSTIELLEVDHIEGYGIYIQNGSIDNLFKNCDAHHLGDPFSTNPWEGANGFNCTGGDNSTRNVFDGCRAYWCSDDGFDFYGINGIKTIKNSWAFWNGYQPGTFVTGGDGMGMKLGPTADDQSANLLRYLENNLAFENRRFGFDQNAGETNTCQYQAYNNIAYNNGENNWFFGANTGINQIFKNNISYDGGINGSEITSGPNVSNNSWNGFTVTAADFRSLNSIGVDGPRQADGSLPRLNFLRLAPGSSLINAGVDVGLAYLQTAPCLGPFEFINNGIPVNYY